MLCHLNAFFLPAKREQVLGRVGKGILNFGRITRSLRGGASFPSPHFNVCTHRPNFALYRGQKAILCANHRLNFMVNVRSRQCVHAGCIHQPSFAYAGSQPMYCSIHKEAGMTDVKNRNPKRQCRGSKACDKTLNFYITYIQKLIFL